MHLNRLSLALCLTASLCLLIPGCGPPANVTATGTVLKDGKPLLLSKTGVVQVTLKPDVPPDKEFTPNVGRSDATGKFEIFEVPPGDYIVGIEILDPDPITDQLSGRLHYNVSKIKRKVDGKTPIQIDLAKPE
jgi:hypothetical protein